MSIALRNLFKHRTRSALRVSGTALAVMPMLLLNGFLNGTARSLQVSRGRLSVGLLIGWDTNSAVLLISNR